MTEDIKNKLILKLKTLMHLTKKQIEKLLDFFININEDDLNEIYKLVLDFKAKIQHCKMCNKVQENEICEICNDKTRENKILLVSKDSDIDKFEALNIYKGKYFIFSNLYNLKGNNEKFTNDFSNLLRLIKKDIEIIFALPFSLEGQLTMEYIKKMLKEKNPNIETYQLSIGLPINASVEYADPITLKKSFLNKQKM